MPFADCGAARLHYQLDGPAEAPVVVLSNSLGTDLSMWDHQARVLSRRLRVLRYDTRGHGQSSTPPGTDWTVADLGRDVLALLDTLGLATASFCGLSLGGMTGIWLAANAGHRLDRLVLCCTSAYLPPADGWHQRAGTVRAQGMGGVADQVLSRWFTPGFALQHPAELERVRGALMSTDPAGYAACCEAIGAMDQRDDLARISAPTLVLAGAEDPATPPEHAHLLAERIAGARLLVLEEAAHLAAVEQPEPVTTAVLRHLGWRSDRYERGLGVRREVLGPDHVDRSLAALTPMTEQFQEFITEVAWGQVWTRPGLDRRTRSCITVAMLVALDKWEELALHLRAALRNGVSREELVEVLLQTAVYAGVPAANTAFAVARRVLEQEGETTTDR